MNVGLCKNCEHWRRGWVECKQSDGSKYRYDMTYGGCAKFIHHMDIKTGKDFGLVESPLNCVAVREVPHGEMGYWGLRDGAVTGPDFGCIHFEGK